METHISPDETDWYIVHRHHLGCLIFNHRVQYFVQTLRNTEIVRISPKSCLCPTQYAIDMSNMMQKQESVKYPGVTQHYSTHCIDHQDCNNLGKIHFPVDFELGIKISMKYHGEILILLDWDSSENFEIHFQILHRKLWSFILALVIFSF